MAKVGRLIKELMVQEVTTALAERQNFFVAGVGRLSAVEADTLRKRLHAVQARFVMVKRTLGRQSLTALKLERATPLLEGSIALIIPGEDLIPAAKLLADFAKADQEKLSVRGGLVDGQLLDSTRFEELASLPPRPQLIAQLIGVLESPMADVVITVERLIGELAWVIEEASKTKPAPAQAEVAQPVPAAEAQPSQPPAPAAPEPPPAPTSGESPTPPSDTTPQQEGQHA